jgi:hypothetical protein
MTTYKTVRYHDIEDYLQAKAEFSQIQEEVAKQRKQGLIVNVDAEYPLPPDGYDDYVIEAKLEWHP